MRLLGYIFSIGSYFEGVRKFKIFTVLGFRIKIRVPIEKNIRKFIQNNRPHPLKQFENISEPKRKKVYLSVLAIFKDEPDIIEWIEYHRLAGVERFYLYDNDSENDYYSVLKPYIDLGLVVYKKVVGRCMQKPVYCDAIYRYKNETNWMAIIDLDEYIVPVQTNDIKDFLRDYEKYPGVVINWLLFDSNGLEKRPVDKTVIESYTRVYRNYDEPINRTVKTILRPSELRFVQSVHMCSYKKNRLAVDENFNPFRGSVYFRTERASHNKIRINHYHCKSREEYYAKINKGFADRKLKRAFDEQKLNFSKTTSDFVILKYLDNLKNCISGKEKSGCR